MADRSFRDGDPRVLDELTPDLRKMELLECERIASSTTYEDAVVLPRYAALQPDELREDNRYSRFIREAMA